MALVNMPDKLESHDIVTLKPVGSLFFADAAEFEENLPDVELVK